MGECAGVSTRKYNLQNLYSAHKSGPVCSITEKGTGTGPRAPGGGGKWDFIVGG